MKKMIVFGLLIIALFLIACGPSEEEIREDMEQLSDEELIEIATSEEDQAIAGEARHIGRARYTTKEIKVAKNILSERGYDLDKLVGFGTFKEGSLETKRR